MSTTEANEKISIEKFKEKFTDTISEIRIEREKIVLIAKSDKDSANDYNSVKLAYNAYLTKVEVLLAQSLSNRKKLEAYDKDLAEAEKSSQDFEKKYKPHTKSMSALAVSPIVDIVKAIVEAAYQMYGTEREKTKDKLIKLVKESRWEEYSKI